MMRPSKTLRKILGGDQANDPTPFATASDRFGKAVDVVRIYYLVSILVAYLFMRDTHAMLAGSPELDPVWSFAPLAHFPATTLVDVLGFTALVFAGLSYFFPHKALFRVAFAVSFFLCGSFDASQGGINHGYHAWLWAGIVFSFLPSAQGRAGQMTYLIVFSTAQALLLMFYTLAGTWKTLYGITALMHGQEGNFSPRGFALILADRIAQTGTSPLLADYLIASYYLAWPLFMALIFIQTVAVSIVYRPQLHVLWGLFLVSFHVGTFLLMEIAFPYQLLLLLILLVGSPFTKPGWAHPRLVFDIPLIGKLLRRFIPQPRPKWQEAF